MPTAFCNPSRLACRMASSKPSTAMSSPQSERPKATDPSETSKPSPSSSPAMSSPDHPFGTARSRRSWRARPVLGVDQQPPYHLSARLHVDVIERIDGRRFGIVLLGPTHAVADRLLLLLEQILEDERAPSAAACMHQRATLVELSQLDGCEPELFGQGRHGSDRVLVVTRQKDDPAAALDDRIGSQDGRTQVIEALHEFSVGERLRDEGGRRETVQLFRGNSKPVHRVDDRLSFP